MIVIEIIFAISFLTLGGIAIKTDLKSGMILNKLLYPFVGISSILNLIYYGIFARDIRLDFFVNLLLVVAVGLFLFYSHAFAGGDCKLSIVLALLYPGRCYLVVSGMIYTLYIAIGLAIFLGYVYLFARSAWKIVMKRKKLNFMYVRNSLLAFVRSLVIVNIYISGISLLTVMVAKMGIDVNLWISRVVCLILAWFIGKNKRLRNPFLVGVILTIDIILAFIMQVAPIVINPSNYVLAVILLICQMTISTDLYDEIDVADLKRGMILSTVSSVLMQGSRVRDLPRVSSEDLRDRLTEVEVESVKRWAKCRNIESIIVVRKIPFAVFLVMGYIAYFLIWSVNN